MSVAINIPSHMQYFTDGEKTVEVNGNTVDECLVELSDQHPGIGKILFTGDGELHSQSLSYISVFINGVDISKEVLQTPVKDGDEIDLVYVILGG